MKTRITELFNIQYPIIQGGMIWASGWRLASAVSNAGGLGLLGAGSMHPETLVEHIRKCKAATDKPFGVNIPIMYPEMDKAIEVILREGVKIVFTSAGNPATYTSLLQKEGIKVAHVVSSSKFALKAQAVRRVLEVPLIAAGGIATGSGMLAAIALGADGVQIGSRFVATTEASVHPAFKEKVIAAGEGDTELTLKELAPVRLLKNGFYEQVKELYNTQKATIENLKALVGSRRTKQGMFEGDMEQGELEIGQVASLITKVQSVQEVINEIITEYHKGIERLTALK